jgi:hypothetical protein
MPLIIAGSVGGRIDVLVREGLYENCKARKE